MDEDGGINKKCIRQTFCSAVILSYIHLRENKFLPWKCCFSLKLLPDNFEEEKNIHCNFFVYKLVLNGAQADKAYCGVGFVQLSKFSQHSNWSFLA